MPHTQMDTVTALLLNTDSLKETVAITNRPVQFVPSLRILINGFRVRPGVAWCCDFLQSDLSCMCFRPYYVKCLIDIGNLIEDEAEARNLLNRNLLLCGWKGSTNHKKLPPLRPANRRVVNVEIILYLIVHIGKLLVCA